MTGALAALRRRWLRGLGWYPGDWIWLSLPTLAVAAAGAVASIEVIQRHSGSPASAATIVAPVPRFAAVTPTASGRDGRFRWPARTKGWTVVLVSSPVTRGQKGPRATAARAAHTGLPQVGVLNSSSYASLHPGYYVVFSGVYSALSDAETALQTVRARGFGGAYSRQITP